MASMARTKMPNVRNGSKGGFEPWAHLIASPEFYQLSYCAPQVTYGVIQELHNTVGALGGGVGSTFPEKSVTKV